jgi:TonB family protein
MRALEGWLLGYLVNALWQAPMVFAAAWVAARVARRSGAAMEHRVWVGALMLEAILPACTLQPVELLRGVWGFWLGLWAGGSVEGTRVTVSTGAGTVHGVLRLPGAILARVALVYGCGVMYFVGRLGWGLWRTLRLRRRAKLVVLPGAAGQSWRRCGEVFGGRGAVAAVSLEIRGPMTIGVWRRMLLLPVGMTESLRAEDFDAAMAHEFAHMQRRDFAKNLVYEAVSLPVAFHPVVWLTRARLAESREMVCDAMAAEAVAGRERYARSLLRLASLLVEGTPVRTLHAIGIFDANIFERRVMNLTAKRMEVRGVRRLAMAAVCVVVGVGTCASALALRMEVSAPAMQSDGQPAPAKMARVSGGVMAVNILTKTQPIYPPDAKAAKISGVVVLHAVIGKDGTIKSLTAVSGPEELKMSAMDAVRQWTYKPYLLNGNPTEVDTTVTVNYSLSPQ